MTAARAADGPLLTAEGLTKHYGPRIGCADVSLEIYDGEVLAVVGESGLGQVDAAVAAVDPARADARQRSATACATASMRDLFALSEAERRFLLRTDWGFVHQDARLGLRMGVSAGGNVGERLMAVGWRHYGHIRQRGGRLARPRRDRRRPHRRHARRPSPAACASACRSPRTW